MVCSQIVRLILNSIVNRSVNALVSGPGNSIRVIFEVTVLFSSLSCKKKKDNNLIYKFKITVNFRICVTCNVFLSHDTRHNVKRGFDLNLEVLIGIIGSYTNFVFQLVLELIHRDPNLCHIIIVQYLKRKKDIRYL